MNNTYLSSTLLKISTKVRLVCTLLLVQINLVSFMFNYFITDYIALHNLYETLDLISENLSILRVVIYLFQFLNSLNTSI